MDARKEKAVVKSKDVQYQRNGDMFIPNHQLAYCILFELPDGEEIILEVPESKFDFIAIGDNKELVWQDYRIIAFGDLEFPSFP